MAIDPRIAMGVQVPDIGSSIQLFQNTLNNIQSRKMNEQSMAQNEAMNPLRQQQAQQAIDVNQSNIDVNRQNEIIRSIADFAPTLKPLLENGNNLGALQALQARKQDLQTRGVDTTQTDEAIQEITNGNPDSVLQSLSIAEREAVNRGLTSMSGMTAGERDRQALTKGFTPEEQAQARRIEAGLAPRAGMSSQERIAADKSLTQDVAQSQATIEGAKEGAKEVAKLSSQLKLKPEVDAAAKTAVLLAQNEAERDVSNRSSKRALDVYNVGISGLKSAMDEAYTGSIAGLMPAITQKSRVADGAIAAMAPILKAMFRSSGEGTFTDKDQEMLVAMIPTRRDDAETRAAKLKNIDAIVRTKLAPSESINEPQPVNNQNQITADDLLNMTPEQLNQIPLEVLKRLGGN